MTTVADLEAYAPQFVGSDVDEVNACLAMAEAQVNRDAWGSVADQGVLSLACHHLMMMQRGKDAGVSGLGVDGTPQGPARRVKVGNTEVEYAVSSLSGNVNTGFGPDTALSFTTYGMEHLRLRRTHVFGRRVL